MRKSIHTPHYKAVTDKLAAMRKDAKLSHRELAARLGREHSFVWRIEKGERRLDMVEFFWVCQALGRDPVRTYRELVKAFEGFENKA